MAFGQQAIFDPIREINASDMSTTYARLGGAFENRGRILSITNNTSQDVYISFDGRTNHLRLAGNSFKVYDILANRVDEGVCFFEIGRQVWTRFVRTTTTSGQLWLELMYAE